MPKNNSHRKISKKVNQNSLNSTELSADTSNPFKRLVGRLSFWVGLLASSAGIVGLFFAYLSVAEPDIRYLPNAQPVTTHNEGISRKDCDCFYYLSVRQPFINSSLKGGYINDIKFVNMSLDLAPTFELIDVDRVKLGWNEQQDVDVKFSLSFSPEDCRKIAQRDKNFTFGVRYLDNTGKQVLYDTQKTRAERTYDVNFLPPQMASNAIHQ